MGKNSVMQNHRNGEWICLFVISEMRIRYNEEKKKVQIFSNYDTIAAG